MKRLAVVSSSQTVARSDNQRRNEGSVAEERALAHLVRQGLSLVQRNYRYKGGEIDLVMRDGNTLVFIEVRKRASMRFGGAVASIDHAKQARLVKTAQHFLQNLSPVPPCRFDVVAQEGEHLSWLQNVIQF